MENKIQFVELQKRILKYFDNALVKRFKDTVQKDKNGYNWVLTFHELRTDSALVAYTKIIFKLDNNKEYLRKNDFLYLNNIPCLYRIIKFDSLKMLESIFDDILNKNLFGKDSIAISEFLVEPERSINNYLSDTENNNFSVFEFVYLPDTKMKGCDFNMYFKMNVNNNQDIYIKLSYKDKYKLIFNFANKNVTVYLKDINNLHSEIAKYIINNL